MAEGVANADEVDKCKQIAATALANGDGEKATRFLQKAKRMNPGDASIDALLADAAAGPKASAQSPQTSASAGPAPAGAPDSGPRQRASAASASSTAAGGTRRTKEGKTYTGEQMNLAQRVLRTKDYYDILEVPRGAPENEIKKAYKKIALKLHPDKNQAPGAEEAFKKVSKAVSCLTDAEKKQMYDRYGDEERMPQQQRGHQHHHEMTPEDIFASFFGGGARGGGGQAPEMNRAQLVQLMPVLLVVLLTLLSNFSGTGNFHKFSFSATPQFKNQRATADMDITYYVSDEFVDNYSEGTQRLAEFDRGVETFYVRQLHSECDFQEKTMYRKVMRAKRSADPNEITKARSHPRPACREIERIKKSFSDTYKAAMYMNSGGF